MEEFLQRTKSRLNRGKHLEKVHTIIGNKSCDLDSIISTLTYAYYLDKITSPGILCLPILNVPRGEFNFYSETRFILEELNIPELLLIFRDEINLQHLNDEGKLSITLVNFSTLTSEDAALEASVVKVINPDKRFDVGQEFHESSSSLVTKEILEEAPELVTRQLAHLLRGSILFCCLSAEHERIPAQEEHIVCMLEEKFPELPPRRDIISSLQETKLHIQGTSAEEIILKEVKELSSGDVKVAISTMYTPLEDLMSYRNIIGELKVFLDKYGFDILILLANYALDEQTTIQQIAVYSENPELCNQVCCELEESQNPCLDLEPSDYGCDQFFVYHQEHSIASCDQVAAIIKEAINRRRIGMIPNSRTSSTEAVAGSAPLSQGSSGIMELYGSDVDPQPNPVNFVDNPQDINGSINAQVDVNVDLVSPDSGLATIRSSRSSKESSVFLSDDSPVAEAAGPHHNFLPGIDSYSSIPESVITEEITPPSRNNSSNLDLFNFDLAPNVRSESSSHSADYSMADDFFFQSDSSEGQQPMAQKEQLYMDDIVHTANCSTVLLNTKVENISLVEFDDDFMHSPETHEDLCEKTQSTNDFAEFDSQLSSEILRNAEAHVPPTPMNSLVESSPLDNGPPAFFPEEVIEKIKEIGATSISQPQAKYAYWWNGGEQNAAHEDLLNVDTWSSSEHSLDSWKDQKPKTSAQNNSETRNSSSSFQVPHLDMHSANIWENHDKNARQEKKKFSDLWKSSHPLPVTSDPWCDSLDTSNDDSNSKYFTKVNDRGKIDIDNSSDNTPDNEMEKIFSQEPTDENQHIPISSGNQNLGTDLKMNVTNTADNLRHIERNLCMWEFCKESDNPNDVDPQITWEDPFLSYRCLDFTTPNTGKDFLVSPPDTNYSTSDSNLSPTSEDDMIELEKPLDEKKRLDYCDGYQGSCDLNNWNNEGLSQPHRTTISESENITCSVNKNTQPSDKHLLAENSKSITPHLQNDIVCSKALSTTSILYSTVPALEESKLNDEMNNHRLSSPISKHVKCKQSTLSSNDIFSGVKEFGLTFHEGDKDSNVQLNLTINESNVFSILHHEDQSEKAGCTLTPSPSNELMDDILWKNHGQSVMATTNTNDNDTSNLSDSLPHVKFPRAPCTESLSPDLQDKLIHVFDRNSIENIAKSQAINPVCNVQASTTTISTCVNIPSKPSDSLPHANFPRVALTEPLSPDLNEKVINVFDKNCTENFGKSQAIHPVQKEEHSDNTGCKNQDTWETDLQDDTESSSLSTPEELDNSDSRNWNMLTKSPVPKLVVTEDDSGKPLNCATVFSSVNNQDYESSNRKSNSSSSNPINTSKMDVSEKATPFEYESLNNKIPIKENIFFTDVASEKHSPSAQCDVEEITSQNSTSDGIWNNTTHCNFESVETDSDLSSSLSNIYVNDILQINPYTDGNGRSSSSHSNLTSPDLDDSWGTLQGLSNDSRSVINKLNVPGTETNEQLCSLSHCDDAIPLEKNPVNTTNKVPMNLDIWNTQICEDSEASTSPEVNEAIDHSNSSDGEDKDNYQNVLMAMDNAGSVLFNESQSSSTTPETDEESLGSDHAQIQFDLFHAGCTNDHELVPSEHTTEEVTCLNSQQDGQQEYLINQEYLLRGGFSLANKSEKSVHKLNNYSKNSEETQRQPRISLSGGDAKNDISALDMVDYSNETLEWWNIKEDQPIEYAYFTSVLQNEGCQENWPIKQDECDNIVGMTTSTGGSPLSAHCCKEEFSVSEKSEVSVTETESLNSLMQHKSLHAGNHLINCNPEINLEEMHDPYTGVPRNQKTETCVDIETEIKTVPNQIITTNTVVEFQFSRALSNSTDVSELSETTVMHDRTYAQQNEGFCGSPADGFSTYSKEDQQDLTNSIHHYGGSDITSPLCFEYVPDTLDDSAEDYSSLHSLAPGLWNITEQHYIKTSECDNPDLLFSYGNSSEASKSPDLCREYETCETYRQNTLPGTDTIYNKTLQTDCVEFSQDETKRKHNEAFIEHVNVCKDTDIYKLADQNIEILSESEEEDVSVPETIHSRKSVVFPEDSLQNSTSHIEKSFPDSSCEHIWEIDSFDHKIPGDKQVNAPSSFVPMNTVTEDNFLINSQSDGLICLDCVPPRSNNQGNEEGVVQNMLLQSRNTHGEFLKEDTTNTTQILESDLHIEHANKMTENAEETQWSNTSAPPEGDIAHVNEIVGTNIQVWNDDTAAERSSVILDKESYGIEMSTEDPAISNAADVVYSRSESVSSCEADCGTKVNSFPLTDSNVVSQQTKSDQAYSANSPDTFQSISMTNESEKQAGHVPECHSLQLEEKYSSIIPRRLGSEKKSEDISEQEHSWSLILSQNETSDTSPEDIFSRTETVDSDKGLGDSSYNEYFCKKLSGCHTEVEDQEYTDLEESFELYKQEESDTRLPSASVDPLKFHEVNMHSQPSPQGVTVPKHSVNEKRMEHRSILYDVGMDIPLDAAEIRPEPPNSLDLNGSHTRKIKLTAPNINLSLDHSEGSILSDDNLDTPDELDINVDDLDTPDEADSFEYPGHEGQPTLGEAVEEDFESIQEYTAEQERADNKLWRTVVIGEQEQRIDMKVIEPYKKVISHGGYYGEGSNAIIVFAACFLPDSSRADYNYVMENLFLYVISTLELMVAEDYMIVYLNGATPRRKMPGLGWMKKCYQMIDRRLRKNLKSFIIVHPSWFIRTILAVTRPFISSKFSSKIKYVSTLAELGELIPMEYVHIPESIVKYEETRCFPRNVRLDEELKENESAKTGCLPSEPEMTSLEQEFEKKNGANV